jgi:hypothetical protein
MVVFPLIAFAVSLACAIVVGRDAWKRPRPDRVVWTIAFGIFAVAAGAEVLGSLWEWNAPLARLYYLTGAVLVVGYLALGELYLLARERIARVAPGLTLLVTALAATLVLNAPIDGALLAEDGWDAIDRGPALVGMTVAINSIGTLILVGGALYSAWRFHTLGTFRHRMIGCVLIALGTLAVASGGTLTRFGRHEYLYIAMSIGVSIIFLGVLQTRRPDQATTAATAGYTGAAAAPTVPGETATPANGKPRLLSLAGNKQARAESPGDQVLAFLETRLLSLSAGDLSAECAIWSVPRQEIEQFTREQARLAWSARTRLSPAAQGAFDSLPPPVRLQVAELYAEVLSAPDPLARSS